MYFDYFKQRAELIGLALALLAVAVAASWEDVRAGLGLLAVGCAVAYPAYRAYHPPRNATAEEKADRKAMFVIIVGSLVLGSGYSVLTEGLRANINAWETLGALVGMGLLVYLLVRHVPRQIRLRKRCPECMTVVHNEARCCANCTYRWKPPLRSAKFRAREPARFNR